MRFEFDALADRRCARIKQHCNRIANQTERIIVSREQGTVQALNIEWQCDLQKYLVSLARLRSSDPRFQALLLLLPQEDRSL